MAQRPSDPAAKPAARHAPALRDPLEAALAAGRREPKRRLKPKALAKGKAAVRRAAKKTAKSMARKTKAKAAGGASPRPKPKTHPVSPLAPRSYPTMPAIRGVTLAAGEAGIRYQGRTDLLLATFTEGTAAAGVFTTSKSASAPVDWCRKALEGGRARGLVVNSGNANAFTGAAGARATKESAKAAAKLLDAEPGEIFLASTGVIGEPLPHEKLTAALPALAKAQRGDAFMAAARAIMTTDTFPKAATRTATIDGATVTINGIAKGSGMIAPDLATMLGFVFTDAKITPAALQTLLLLGVRDSFNCITVDSDTSTSDTVLAFATGLAGNDEIARPGDRRLASFKEALDDLLLELALLVVRDGEGARKLIQVDVTGAESPKAAKVIAMAIANSPLVKTAVAGEDANWGRVVMAVGKAGEAADRDRLTIRFGPHVVAKNGQRAPDYDEAKVSAYVRGDRIEIGVDLGLGRGTARVWTCDLTEGYIRINGAYRS